MRGDPLARRVDMRHYTLKIDTDPGRVDTILTGVPNVRQSACGSDERFAGYTTRPQALAAHAVSFDERYLRTQAGRACGRDETSGAATDRDDVVSIHIL